MAQVFVRDNENLEAAIKRFGRKVDDEKILKEWRDRQYFVKPSMQRREKVKAALRKQDQRNARNRQMLKNMDRK